MKAEIIKATANDIEHIKTIADANKSKIGFIRRQALFEQQKRGWLIAAKINSQVVGFASYRHRKDNQTTLYEICVTEEHQGSGLGTQLMDFLVKESRSFGKDLIILKCPAELRANRFYSKYGFLFRAFEQGKSRPLIVWELPLN